MGIDDEADTYISKDNQSNEAIYADDLMDEEYEFDDYSGIYDNEELDEIPPREEEKVFNSQKDINAGVKKDFIPTKEPEYYKINYLNIHKYIFELRYSKDKEWVKFLKENYEGDILRQLYGMTTFETVKRFYEEDKKTIKEDRPAITPEFIKAIHNFYKNENLILNPIYSKEELIEDDLYISTQTNQFYWYKKGIRRALYISIFGEPKKERDLFNSMSKETFDLFVSFELANYCYNNNERLTFYPKDYSPKYILNENVKYIKQYISNIDNARQLYM